jgi:hypothetical protein
MVWRYGMESTCSDWAYEYVNEYLVCIKRSYHLTNRASFSCPRNTPFRDVRQGDCLNALRFSLTFNLLLRIEEYFNDSVKPMQPRQSTYLHFALYHSLNTSTFWGPFPQQRIAQLPSSASGAWKLLNYDGPNTMVILRRDTGWLL